MITFNLIFDRIFTTTEYQISLVMVFESKGNQETAYIDGINEDSFR